MYSLIIIFIVLISAAYVYHRCRRDFLTNPSFYFIFFQLVSFLGTVSILEFSSKPDIYYFFLNTVGFLMYIFGFIVGDTIFPVSPQVIKTWKNSPLFIERSNVFTFQIYALIVLSAIICVAYFYAVGYNVFLVGFTELFSTGGVTQDISYLRLASYNSLLTGKYYYPGYVNQFKDTLYPLCIFYLWGRFSLIKGNVSRKSKLFLWLFSIISLISILGTGQRGAFVLVLIMGGAFLLIILEKQARKKVAVYGGAVMLTFFMISTFINGRTSSATFSLSGVFTAIWERISSDNQWSALIGFRGILYTSPTQWGHEWLQALYGLSPSNSGSTLSNDIGQLIYGGFGTSPPSSIGSIYYNFSWLGIVFFPFFFSLTIKYFYKRFYSKPKYLFRILIYTAGFVLMGTWLAGNPVEYFFNAGLIAIIALKFIIKILNASFFKNRYVHYPKNI